MELKPPLDNIIHALFGLTFGRLTGAITGDKVKSRMRRNAELERQLDYKQWILSHEENTQDKDSD